METPGYTPEQHRAGLRRLQRDLDDPGRMALREVLAELDELRDLNYVPPMKREAVSDDPRQITYRRLGTLVERITTYLEKTR
jgi:hypothetical protein